MIDLAKIRIARDGLLRLAPGFETTDIVFRIM